MKTRMTIAGYSVMTLMFLTACGAQQVDDTNQKTSTTTVADKPVPVVLPVPKEPGPHKRAPFSPEMSAEFMRKVMETSARIEAVKKEIADRQAVIFETHPEVKAYRAQLINMQKQINTILETDMELTTLKMNRDMLWTTMPTLPRGKGPSRGFIPMK